MPRVPQADNISVLPGQQPTPQARMFDAPEVRDYGSRQILAQSEALGRAGSAATGIAADITAQANRVRLDDAQNRLMAVATDLEVRARGLKGKNALERPDGKALPDEFGEELTKAAKDIEDGLGNDFQRQNFRSSVAQLGTRFRATLAQHMVGEQRTFAVETAKSGIAVAVDRAIKLAGDEPARQEALAGIDGHVDALARAEGWDADTTARTRLEARSQVHAGLMATMIAGGQSRQARAYYDANSAEMTVQARTTMLPKLQEASDAQEGDGAAAAAWAKLGPKTPNDAIKQADLENEVRGMLKDNPKATAVAIAALRDRAQAHNVQQTELRATNVAGVWKQFDAGVPMAKIQQSDAWLALTDTERRQIRREREQELYQAESRAAARAARAASEAGRALAERQRELTGLQIDDRLNLLRNGAEYLTASDPDVLSKMSRAQVEAKRGTFGFEGTQALLAKWDTLQKPGKVAEARMDQDDFNQVADSLGLKPFDPKKSEDERRALGNLKYRVEALIGVEQSKRGGKEMARAEKMELMRSEMARTVTVDTWGWNNAQRPVVGLTPSDVRNVMIPPAERRQIEEALRARGQPVTDESVRRLYLRGVSPAGAMVTE